MDSEMLSDKERDESVKSFEKLGICTQLAEAAASLGWKIPSSIQQQAIPSVLEGTNPTSNYRMPQTHMHFPSPCFTFQSPKSHRQRRHRPRSDRLWKNRRFRPPHPPIPPRQTSSPLSPRPIPNQRTRHPDIRAIRSSRSRHWRQMCRPRRRH
jgi:hypothetical protein